MALKLLMRPSGLLIPFRDLGIEGAPERQLTLGDDLPYVVALNMGHDGNQPRLLKMDAAGSLQVAIGPTSASGGVFLSDNASNALSTGGFGDAVASGQRALFIDGQGYLFNNATSDRARSASAANLIAESGLGAALSASPGEWAITSNPGAGVVASATRAAGAAGVRHICRGFSFACAATVAPAVSGISVLVRDGASGAGTILWQAALAINAATGMLVGPVVVAGLNLVGSAATAMTIEFNTLIANLQESVNLSGYDAA